MRGENRKILISLFLFNLLFILAINFTVVANIIEEWWSVGAYNHGLLGFSLAVYVLWTKRDVFSSPQGSLFGLVILIFSSLLLLFANLASIGQLQVLSLFLIIVALLFSFFGILPITRLLLPLLMVFLILPIWNILQIPLRDLSTWVSFHSVDLLGFEIVRQGYKLITPSGNFLVEEACSGLSFFLASALYAVFVAQVNHLSRKATIVYFTFSVLIAIVANWIRITIIIIVGSQTAMQHFIVKDHLTFGWLVFAACFIPVIIIGNTYFGENPDIHDKQKPVTTPPQQVSPRHVFAISIITLLFSAATIILPSRFDPDYKFTLPIIPSYTHLALNNKASQNWSPISYGATSEEFNYFLQGEDLLQVYLANYVRQRQGEEMIFIKNTLFDENRWLNVRQQTASLNSSYLRQVNLITLRKNNDRSRLIAYWYLVDNQFIADKKIAKLLEVKAAIKGKPGATLIAVAIDYNNKNEAYALKTMTNFVTVFSSKSVSMSKRI